MNLKGKLTINSSNRWAQSSLHGISHIIHVENILGKLIWLSVYALSLILCITLSIEQINMYLNYSVNVRVRYVQTETNDLPAVAVCNSNPFVTEYAIDYLIHFIQNFTGDSFNKANQSRIDFINSHLIDNYHLRYLAADYAFYNLTKTEQQKLGLPFDKVLIDCQFFDKKCTHADFEWMYSWYNGNCLIFNLKNDFILKNCGKESAFSLELFTGFPSLIPYYTPGFGIYIFCINSFGIFF